MATPNGTFNNGPTATAKEIPATTLLATFVATANPDTHLTPALRDKTKEVLIDYLGVAAGALQNANSTPAILDAVRKLQGPGNTGPCSVLAQGARGWLPQFAGMLNAALGHSLDFDDTYAPGTLHAGVTAVPAALAAAEEGEEGGTSSERFMLAVAVGYEVTCRLGRELGYGAYSRGFHNTGTAGVFGAVAAIAVVRGLGMEIVEAAFGLAGSKAAGSMQYLDNGSWNKRLHPGFAVHDGFVCVGLAEAGVVGATRALEGKHGFLQAYSPSGDVDLARLTGGLGRDWEFLKSSLKPWSACRMTHGFIEMAGKFCSRRDGVASKDIRAVTLWLSPSNFLLVGDPIPNKIRPSNVIDAQFSAYFQVANALLYGSSTGLEAYRKLSDSSIQEVCAKTNVEQDVGMVGFSCKIRVEWVDGAVDEEVMQYPLGEEQHPFTRDRVDEKFLSLATPVYGDEKARKVIELVDGLESHSVEQLLNLIQ
ncbi:hypothetical protein MBLNU230_g3948t1 [Neophaeotheca triangularis]